MTSQVFSHTHSCLLRNLPKSTSAWTVTPSTSSKRSRQCQKTGSTCLNSKQSQTKTHSAVAPLHPEFFPEQTSEIREQAALDVIARMQRTTVTADSLTCPVATAYLGPSEPSEGHRDQPPVLLLHGFDSSSLEFRRLLPLLEKKLEAWTVDLVGWGFSDSGAATQTDMQLGPQQKQDHLYAFWKEKCRSSGPWW